MKKFERRNLCLILIIFIQEESGGRINRDTYPREYDYKLNWINLKPRAYNKEFENEKKKNNWVNTDYWIISNNFSEFNAKNTKENAQNYAPLTAK